MTKHRWYCFYRLQWNHLEFVYDTKEKSERWLDFWDHDPSCYVIEVLE